MLRIDIHKCMPGMTLALPVINPRVPGQVLLKANFTLDQSAIDRLPQIGINHVWLRYPSLTFLEKFVNQEVLKAQEAVVTQITSTFEAIQKQATAKLPYEQYTQSIGQLVDQLLANPQAAIFMGDLMTGDQPDKAMMRHSTAVTYLSLLMGLKLEGYLVRQRRHVDPAQAKEVIQLGIGAMLHDVGVTQLEAAVRNRFLNTGQEDGPWREHADLGYKLVRGKLSPTAATIVLNHHQRYDGSGYGGPGTEPMEGQRIHVFARIVAMADYFDECRHPAKGAAQPAAAVLNHILSSDVMKKFDPQVLRALLTVVPPYPPGCIIRLSDGRYAAAIDHNPADPCRPQVQIIPDPATTKPDEAGNTPGPTLDLSLKEHASLHVAMCDDQDVMQWNFPAPEMMKENLATTFM